MEIEVIVQNGAEAIAAERLGADRLELVSAIQEGGLTPSYGTIKQVLASVSIPVYIMVRPHSYHYDYQENEMQIIHEDVKNILQLGGNKIVFGSLNADLTINEAQLASVINISKDLLITFHRAFDETPSVIDAYRTLTTYHDQVKTILTSGGMSNCLKGKQQLTELVAESRKQKGPQIMPGAGLSVENIEEIHQTVQASHYHFGKAVRVNQSFHEGFAEDNLKRIRQAI
ncbi:MAG TPA: copper homeostasis protein CutC [Virgibacillus sp.]|nr:copper homeostasis protein CutC [Virgibacillus sp.]